MESPRHPVLQPFRRAPIAALLLSLLVRAAPTCADVPDSLAKPMEWDSPGSIPAAAKTSSTIQSLDPFVLTLLELSKRAYDADHAYIKPPDGWMVQDTWYNENEVNATLLVQEQERRAVLVFRGTRLGDAGDISTNLDYGYVGNPHAKNLAKAAEIAVKVREKYPHIVLTGHSKGGAEAAFAAATIDRPAVVFASPGLPYRIKQAWPDREKNYHKRVVNIYLEGDAVVGWGLLPHPSTATPFPEQPTALLQPARMVELTDQRFRQLDGFQKHDINKIGQTLARWLADIDSINHVLGEGTIRAGEPARPPAPPPASNQTRSGLWEAANGWRLEFRGNSARLLEPSGFSDNYNEVYRGVVKPAESDTVVIAWTYGSSAGFMNELPGGVGPIRWEEKCRLTFDDAGGGMVIESLSGKDRGTKTRYRLVHP